MSSDMPSDAYAIWAKHNKCAHSGEPRLYPVLESIVLDTFKHIRKPQDLTWLWVGGRHVSKHFRCEIERIFRTVFVPETILYCNMGVHLLCWDIFTSNLRGPAGCHTDMATTMVYDHGLPCFIFHRFSDDHSKAFFRFAECFAPKATTATAFRRIHEKQLVGAPAFSIQVGQIVNDMGLPNLHIDDENEEISFDWIGMLDQLMGEEHVYNTILSQRLGLHLDPGDGDDENLNLQSIQSIHRKLARRSRLQRECRAKYGSNILEHYVRDEAPALQNLQRLRVHASSFKDEDDDDNNSNCPPLYSRQHFLSKLPRDAVIYSANADPSPPPGSIPRGIFTDTDYCAPIPSPYLPAPSALDLFSARPLPTLSWGRRRVYPQVVSWKQNGMNEGMRRKRKVEGDEGRKRRRGGGGE